MLIVKYFPGGLFAFLDKYKEEIAAGTATFVLVGAVRKAVIEKQEAEAERIKKQQTAEPEGVSHDHAQ